MIRRILVAVGIFALFLVTVAGVFDLERDTNMPIFALFVVMAVSVAVLTPLLVSMSRRIPSFRITLLLIATSGLVVVASVVIIAGVGMFLTVNQVQLLLVALSVGMLIAGMQTWFLSDLMTRDLTKVESTLDRIADGDLTMRSRLKRRDEVGSVGGSVDALADRLNQLEQARADDRNARSDLFSNIGHDLRTPLASTLAAVEALQDGVATNPSRYLEAIARDNRHIAALVEDLFLLTRIDTEDLEFKFEPSDISELAEGSVDSLRPIADQRNVKLELTHPGALPAVTSPAALTRVLRNVIDNAIRHAKSRVDVRVHLRRRYVVVEIEDDGPGFPTDVDVFGRFTRGDEARSRDGSGAGLGLAISRGLINSLGGHITIRPGTGGRVRATIPAQPPKTGE
ncbi:MAG: HAMP domain-containing protein [Acidimicrobiia bacterium]|nr:HAMP domain-containing protein [Acidimicrobiia bacterium]